MDKIETVTRELGKALYTDNADSFTVGDITFDSSHMDVMRITTSFDTRREVVAAALEGKLLSIEEIGSIQSVNEARQGASRGERAIDDMRDDALGGLSVEEITGALVHVLEMEKSGEITLTDEEKDFIWGAFESVIPDEQGADVETGSNVLPTPVQEVVEVPEKGRGGPD